MIPTKMKEENNLQEKEGSGHGQNYKKKIEEDNKHPKYLYFLPKLHKL